MSNDLKLLVDNLHFSEGPRWHDGKFWYSDFYQKAVFCLWIFRSVDIKKQFVLGCSVRCISKSSFFMDFPFGGYRTVTFCLDFHLVDIEQLALA